MTEINITEIVNKDGFWVTCNVIDGFVAANYNVFFTALYPCEVMVIAETHRVLGTDAGAVTLNVEKLKSGQALDAGSTILLTAFNLKATINTPQIASTSSQELVFTSARTLLTGDRLALKDTGVLTDVDAVSVTVYLKRLGKGQYQ